MAKLHLGKDINGSIDFSLPAASYVIDAVLTPGDEQHFVTPPGYNRMFISSLVGTDIYVSIDAGTATFPSSTFTQNPSNTELNPNIRQINILGGQTISVISAVDTEVSFRLDLSGGQYV